MKTVANSFCSRRSFVGGVAMGSAALFVPGVFAEELLRTRFAVTKAPRKSADSPSGADVPAAVKRAVYLRDRGQCTYVSKDGRRCESRRFLQFDHILGRAVGGAFTVDNVRLRCGPHNRLEAERLYATPPGARHAGGARVDLSRIHRPWGG